MQSAIEKTYGKFFKYLLVAANPFKKIVIHTECIIHKFINEQSLIILKNDKYTDAFNFFSKYIEDLNDGVVWADQDFKSSSHFFNPSKNKGLYGSQNAMSLCSEYYNNAIKCWNEGLVDKSMFYLGAAVHLVQDMTVPQHANIRLLNNHRQYENFIKRTFINTPRFLVDRGGYYGDSVEEYLRCNARNAIIIFNRLKDIKKNKKRYYTIAKFTLPLAQRTTAGCLYRFYKDVVLKKPVNM